MTVTWGIERRAVTAVSGTGLTRMALLEVRKVELVSAMVCW